MFSSWCATKKESQSAAFFRQTPLTETVAAFGGDALVD